MKIVFCLNHFLPCKVAGTEIYTFHLAKQLQQLGVEPLVIIPNFQKEESLEYVHEGVNVIAYAENSVKNKAMFAGTVQPAGLPLFEKLLSVQKPDLVHFQEIGGSNGISLHHVRSVKKMKVPYVITFHLAGYSCNTGTLMYMNKIKCNGFIDIQKCSACSLKAMGLPVKAAEQAAALSIILQKTFLRHLFAHGRLGTLLSISSRIKHLRERLMEITTVAKQSFTVANWYREVLILNKIPGEKIEFVSQALPEFSSFPAEHKQFADKIRFVYVGRITASKGLHILLQAMQLSENKSLSLSVYGQETEEGYAKEVKAMAIGLDIHWKGMIPPHEVVETLSGFDIVCIPSVICEMSPLIIEEAFAAGIPVLASDVYGNVEKITEDQDGFLFPVGNIHSLATVLKELTKEKIERLSTERKRNNFAHVASVYQAHYSNILAGL